MMTNTDPFYLDSKTGIYFVEIQKSYSYRKFVAEVTIKQDSLDPLLKLLHS